MEGLPENEITYCIGIAAGKGGVGKSTLSVNLALALKRKGYRVGILDADVYGPSIPKMLQLNKSPEEGARDGFLKPGECLGMQVISTAFFRKEKEAAIVRAPIANAIVEQFLYQIEWGNLDFLIIDFPPGTGDIPITLAQKGALDGVLFVTTPQEVAALDVKKAVEMFKRMHVPLLGVVENMSYFLNPEGEKLYLFGQGAAKGICTEYKIPFLGQIPLDPEISKCCDLGESLIDTKDSSIGAVEFNNLAALVEYEVNLLRNEEEEEIKDFEIIWQEMD